MMKRIIMILWITCFGMVCLSPDLAMAERMINIPVDLKGEKVGDSQILRLPDGSKIEVKKIVIYDNVPIRDNIFGECEVKIYDKDGRLQEGNAYIIMNPAEGRLVGDEVKIPARLRFLPVPAPRDGKKVPK